MGEIKHMAWATRREKTSDFASHTGDIYMAQLFSDDRAIAPVIIWATSPTTSHFNAYDDGTAVPNGSLLIDIAASGKMYLKQGATTWTEIGNVT